MSKIVRAIDVGFGTTKYVVAHAAQRVDLRVLPIAGVHECKGPVLPRVGGASQDGRNFHRWHLLRGGPGRSPCADTFRATQLHDQYIESPEYMALARGALRYMKQDAIDVLVVGLTVSSFQAR